ncbi:hypothetical protein AcW1_009329 [Taiwanofungus camphoratus]|nr:hypothetical protein AcV7_003986 [Antrodia cinnamomea]KAI0947616.1 hypothetical protein AcW1_009329 [Antrodia cinnamomea]
MTNILTPLPPFPSSKARASLSPSQLAVLNQSIASSLTEVLAAPDQQDRAATHAFLASYAKDAALEVLKAVVWGDERTLFANLSKFERTVRQHSFLLAERLAASGSLDLQIMLDLGVAYASTNPARLRSLFSVALGQNNSLITTAESEAVPAFTTLLSSPSQGIYGLRKTAYVLLSLLRPAPPSLVRPFSRSKSLVLALAHAYDHGLATLAQSYGGLRVPNSVAEPRLLDDWERIYLETKVALVDVFHILVGGLLADIASVPAAGRALAEQCEAAFEIVFALLELPPSQARTGDSSSRDAMPFLDQPLLADYEHAYDLSRTLREVLRRAEDPRTELLENTLRELDRHDGSPGALKLLIRSSGVPPGIDSCGRGQGKVCVNAKGKGKASDVIPPTEEDTSLDAAVAQVLDVLPDQPPQYLRFLLSHPDYPYRGNAERLVEGLLEGTAPGVEEVEITIASGATDGGETQMVPQEEFHYTKERRNVFDGVNMELSQVRFGKKNDDISVQDRAYIGEMKADILRRAEQISDSEEENEYEHAISRGERKGKGRDVAFEEELEEESTIKVRDGEGTDDEGDSQEDGERTGDSDDDTELAHIQPETILELAYLRDPTQFDRDGETRRSKARASLKDQTGLFLHFTHLGAISMTLGFYCRLDRRANRGMENHVRTECGSPILVSYSV